MRTRKGSKTALALAAAGILVLNATMAQAADISVGSTTVPADGEGSVAVTLNVESGETAVGTLTDIGFETGASVPARSGVSAILAENITATDTAIPVDDASDLQSFGTIQIDDEMIAYGEKRDNVLVAGGCTGGDSGTACLVNEDCAGASAVCEPSGRGQGGTTAAEHLQNAGIETPTTPNCTMSSALETLNKDAVFSFLPSNCPLEVPCDTVRGIVIALDNLNPFPEGMTELFSCTIAAGAAEETFPLVCADGQVSDSPDGEGLITDGPCTDGSVTVGGCTCVGDQDGNGSVTSAEATRAVLAFTTRDPSQNPAADCDASGAVSSGEATRSVLNFTRRQCTP